MTTGEKFLAAYILFLLLAGVCLVGVLGATAPPLSLHEMAQGNGRVR
jgi:hypothetical protein